LLGQNRLKLIIGVLEDRVDQEELGSMIQNILDAGILFRSGNLLFFGRETQRQERRKH